MSKTNRYSPEYRERAVRLVLEYQEEHDSQWAALKDGLGRRLLRKLVHQAESCFLLLKAVPRVYEPG